MRENEVPKEYWTNICKVGQGAACCKYLVFSKHMECCKDNPYNKKVIDDNWATTPHVAQGDNCKGYLTEKKSQQ